MNDLLIFVDNIDKYLERLDSMLKCLFEKGLVINKQKCKFIR